MLGAYQPPPGVADELLDASGAIRPVWRQFIEHLAGLKPAEIARRFARGDQYLRDAGVFYRQYGASGSTERAWPLSHVPVVIHASEWRDISEGLVQRAELLEAVVADLYGANRLVAEGCLPAALIARNPEWLRPLVGVQPRGGAFLNFIAFEMGRGPDGAWRVLGDRTQAPSGAGFALENRVATSRVFSDLYPDANVHRLAGFFQTFRDALRGLRLDGDSPVGILTPGPLTDTYYEHAYIARYLGLTLLEGEDLAVADGKVMVRTVAGLRPVSVLWRRLDASWSDPLELDEGSRLGTPGLVEAVRQGNVTIVNALGSGVLEMRALLAFLPRICRSLRGEPLRLPNIATWWCGQPVERAHVLANADRMMIGPAFSSRLPFETGDATAPGGHVRAQGHDLHAAMLEADGLDLVGQEAITPSTTPAFVDGRLEPRPVNLRVFLARNASGGWEVMPGGYARIGGTADTTAIAMQRGGSVADVWIVGDAPVETISMLPAPASPYHRAQPGVLPSRAADNLYWLGRYVERAETVMRLLRAYNVRFSESGDTDGSLLIHLKDHLERFRVDPADGVPSSLCEMLASAVGSAGQVRDRFSVDGWMALDDLAKTAARFSERVTPGDDAARAMGVLLRKITGFSGLVHENMYRSSGWRFLTIGRSLERILGAASALADFCDPAAPEGSLDLVVEIGDSSMTHRRRYAIATNRNTVIDLLALDAFNPRSILYQLTEIRDQADRLPGATSHGQMSALTRAILQTHTQLAVRSPDSLDAQALLDIRASVAVLSDALTAAYLR
ncbi:MAG: circularly permuted type 2 ATP-grasp protein [Alphaproteobacteria bacterium]|nr:circularly permuted type 2 ATP-grasp protein [Alphaproteobacteria bacterium]